VVNKPLTLSKLRRDTEIRLFTVASVSPIRDYPANRTGETGSSQLGTLLEEDPAGNQDLASDSSQRGTSKPLHTKESPNHMLIDTIKTGIVTPNFEDTRLFVQDLLRNLIAASAFRPG